MSRFSEEQLRERKEHTIILTQTNPETDTMFDSWKAYGLHANIVFWECPRAVRAVRRLWVDGHLPGTSMWYGDWKHNLSSFDTVILHASERMRKVPRWIHHQQPNMRIIYWYWNPVNKQSLPSLAFVPGMECWSFDPDDCKKYGMKRNIQYYYAVPNLKQINPRYDVYFVGHDKGRGERVHTIQAAIEAAGFTMKVDLLGDGDPFIPYSEIQRRIARASAILEVNQQGQMGYTLRALESIFLGKKLITSNSLIRKEDFYRPENIFILGEDKDLCGFMRTPLVDVSEYQHQLDINAWFSNFFK